MITYGMFLIVLRSITSMIDLYTFGQMIIDGERYTTDLIIYPDSIDAAWRRKEGHRLCIVDIQDVIAAHPEYLVIGTGYSGLMKVLPATQEYLQGQGIQLIACPTKQACELFNEILTKCRLIGVFHLTC